MTAQRGDSERKNTLFRDVTCSDKMKQNEHKNLTLSKLYIFTYREWSMISITSSRFCEYSSLCSGDTLESSIVRIVLPVMSRSTDESSSKTPSATQMSKMAWAQSKDSRSSDLLPEESLILSRPLISISFVKTP